MNVRCARDAGALDWRTWADVTVPSSSSIHELLESGPVIHEELPSAYPLLIIVSDLVSALQGLNSSRRTKAFALIEERRWERAASSQHKRAPQIQSNDEFIFTEDNTDKEEKTKISKLHDNSESSWRMASKSAGFVVVLVVISQISAFPTPAGPDGELGYWITKKPIVQYICPVAILCNMEYLTYLTITLIERNIYTWRVIKLKTATNINKYSL